MGLRDDWSIHRAHIEAIVENARPFSRWTGPTTHALVNQAAIVVVDDAKRAWHAVDKFIATNLASLPPAAATLHNEWRQHQALITSGSANHPLYVDQAIAWVCLLGGVRGNVDRLLSDSELVWRSVIERAFEHLQRSIIVDMTLAAKWKAARNEPRCENLGAVHLLLHGIWGFKVDAAGERTDLVLGEVINTAAADRAERAGTALVLTEWKRLRNGLPIHRAIADIEKQVTLYKRGSLAAVELKRTCYGVIVSEKYTAMPADKAIGDYTLRFVNVAVDPSVPSKAVPPPQTRSHQPRRQRPRQGGSAQRGKR